jgi:DNA sulfur modification protein DndC
MSAIQPTLFDNDRTSLSYSIEVTAASLNSFGADYDHWAIAFSGGKDSATVVSVVCWLIETRQVKAPKSLTVLMSDTRMEMPPLFSTAMTVMQETRDRGHEARLVWPEMDDRFFVYMLGRGVPPPSNTFRWCTAQLKIEPMVAALKDLREAHGKKLLMLTGVRVGESAARDARIAVSCGKNNTECGQGWFQESTPEAVADTLAPILHWRLCQVWDWLTGMTPAGMDHGFSTKLIAAVYGQDENLETHARTGCVGCNLASRDFALEQIIRRPQWAGYAPLMELRPLYAELKLPRNRIRKDGTETRKDGSLVANPCRMGPLTMDARRYGLAKVRDIQARAGVDLINADEEARIIELIEANTWPRGWDGTEQLASDPFDNVNPDGSIQPIMMALYESALPS